MKVIAIGGQPATGKSTLIRALMADYDWFPFKEGLVRGHISPLLRIGIIGIYNGHKFPGTDRLSMAVQPKAEHFLASAAQEPNLGGYTWIFEGDRLFTRSFLQFIKQLSPSAVFLILTASAATMEARHRERQDTQPAAFLKAKATKVRNISSDFHANVVTRTHETEADTFALVQWLREQCQ